MPNLTNWLSKYVIMKAYRIIGVLVIAVLVCGCKGKKDKEADEDTTEMARGSYNAEKNVVTVVPLERKVFNKQLVCNGKLEAQSKVTVQFEAQGKTHHPRSDETCE